MQNLAPGATDRIGLSNAELRARYPRLIVCNISGYGSSGPYRDKKAYDLLIQCETGLVSITGTPETASKVGISAADIAAGMYAFSGILLALETRRQTGHGTVLDVSLFDSLGEWMTYAAYFTAYGGSPPPRTGASHASIAPYGPYSTGDGKQVNLGIQNEREWEKFCAIVLQNPQLAGDPRFNANSRRSQNREALREAIWEVFRNLTLEQAVERLDKAGIANASMNSMREFWEHPQLKVRDRWREVETPVGRIPALQPPIIMEDMEARMDPVPGLGEHTETILRELRYVPEQIEKLRTEGAV
jgi:itaconate CoA-transferase